ncbi:hypothetical protein [Paenibacillus lignilyticus]|uniref:Uncharacterized protein n=1 Tax=Paenibacillus lignilyticus TaxID=1172615 RepID=A0ABS5C6M3_9BACL|nr:hypothetical protein [Paenibacillus lignilyticus]MBP3961643.1 hypothetical protein [Paenibacillus lignilyticus]MBP3963687.1 hypothetical protein [Paenibacillus lignilyticus]
MPSQAGPRTRAAINGLHPLPNSPPQWNSTKVTVHITVALVLAFLSAWYLSQGYNLSAVILCELYMIIAIGKGKLNHPLGILINERNLMSLSRLQITLWTVLFTSTYFTILVGNLALHPEHPLQLKFDSTVLALMGISSVSAIFSPMINGAKKNRAIDDSLKNQLVQSAAEAYNMSAQEIETSMQGTLYANPSYKDAQFSDIFEGEEMQNHAYIDIAKVQMFLFTMMALMIYSVTIYSTLMTQGLDAIESFPALPEELIGLIGISNGGYLTSKIINFTKSTPT